MGILMADIMVAMADIMAILMAAMGGIMAILMMVMAVIMAAMDPIGHTVRVRADCAKVLDSRA